MSIKNVISKEKRNWNRETAETLFKATIGSSPKSEPSWNFEYLEGNIEI